MTKGILFLASFGLIALLVSAVGMPAPRPNPVAMAQSASQHPAAQTFTGIVTRIGNAFLLDDKADNVAYRLDDAAKASQFEGKTVKVTGVLDVPHHTIHVQFMQESS